MIEDYYYIRKKRNKSRIEKFWKERPDGYKLCPECFKIFDTDGFPIKDSWTCSKSCFASCNIRNPIIQEETILRFDRGQFWDQFIPIEDNKNE